MLLLARVRGMVCAKYCTYVTSYTSCDNVFTDAELNMQKCHTHTHTHTHTYSQTMSCGVMSLWGNGVRTEWSYGVALVG